MNCWKPLRAIQDHNVAGDGKRDGLKTWWIGQSAAKRLRSFKLFYLGTEIFKNIKIRQLVCSSAPWRMAMKFTGNEGLRSFCVEIWEHHLQYVHCGLVAPNNFIDPSARVQNTAIVYRAIKNLGEMRNGFVLAHGDFQNHAVLEPDRASLGGESVDHNTALTINDTCEIGDVSCFQNKTSFELNVQRPSRNGVQPSGWKDATTLPYNYLYVKHFGLMIWSFLRGNAQQPCVGRAW